MTRFYVSDLDGTLLNPRAELSATTRAGLHELLLQGLTFTVASARNVISMRRILHGLPLSLPLVSSNGAYLSDFATGRYELVNAIESDVAQALLALVRRHRLMPFVATYGRSGEQLFWQEVCNAGQQRFVDERQELADPRLRHCHALERVLQEPMVTLLVVDKTQPLQDLQQALHEAFAGLITSHLAEDMYMPGWAWLNVHDHRASKDQAIAELARRYGLSSHPLVVFGDQSNDLSMLRAAHHAVAVANASDEVKRSAHQIIGHHAQDAVLKFLQDDWQASRPR
ncbi:HAD family hydrolase [Roseateles sp. BYS180W]|uniref:HAD family hydrolase n=1 Tax=Roseateles rivi TaxID=3299028 RepID=A0ABW7FSM2_9BURK